MSTILVTGGAGFIGSHLCEKLLDQKHFVINLDNFNDFYDPLLKKQNIETIEHHPCYVLVKGDIRDEDLVGSIFKKYHIDTVIHLAALAGVRTSISNPLEYVDVDIKGTVNLLEFSKKYSVKKFVFASSSSVYGSSSAPCREEDPVNHPVSPYAAAKCASEIFCSTYSSLYGISAVCLRFFTVYGPRQRPEMAIRSFTRLIDQEREILVYGRGTSSRDYTYVDDVVDGIIAAANFDCKFEIFNLGNSSPVKLNDLIGIIERKLGKYAYKRYMPAQRGDVEHTCADTSKAGKLLGYSPKVSIEDGIGRFVDWYRKSMK